MKEKTRKLIDYWLSRMGEASTFQGIAFFFALFGAKIGAELDWGQAAAAGGAISGFLKLLLPDQVKK